MAAGRYECSRCTEGGEDSQAVAFCVVCTQHLCLECWISHTESNSTQNHQLLEDVPPFDESYRLMTRRCDRHPDEQAAHFCSRHEVFACGQCFSDTHESCKAQNLSRVCRRPGQNEKKKVAQMIQDYCNLKDKILNLKTERRRDLEEFIEGDNGIFEKIHQLRRDINRHLDHLEEMMRQSSSEKMNEVCKKRKETIEELEKDLAEVKREMGTLIAAFTKGDEADCFAALKRSHIKSIQDSYLAIEAAGLSEKADTTFQPDPRIQQLIAFLDQLVQIAVPTRVVFKCQGANKMGEWNVKDSADKESCRITGSLFLPDNRLILCDFHNAKLKLLDEKFSLVSSIQLSSEPWDFTLINDKEVVVSLPKEKKLQHVSLSPALTLGKTIDVKEGECRGVHFHKDRLYISCVDPACLLVYNTKDETTTRLGLAQDGVSKLTFPCYVTVDAEDRVLVSDMEQSSVICLQPDGRIVYNHSDASFQGPAGVLVDDKQSVLVGGAKTDNIRVINRDGQKGKELLQTGTGSNQPYSLAYRPMDDTLAVGLYDYDKIVTFKLS